MKRVSVKSVKKQLDMPNIMDKPDNFKFLFHPFWQINHLLESCILISHKVKQIR